MIIEVCKTHHSSTTPDPFGTSASVSIDGLVDTPIVPFGKKEFVHVYSQLTNHRPSNTVIIKVLTRMKDGVLLQHSIPLNRHWPRLNLNELTAVSSHCIAAYKHHLIHVADPNILQDVWIAIGDRLLKAEGDRFLVLFDFWMGINPKRERILIDDWNEYGYRYDRIQLQAIKYLPLERLLEFESVKWVKLHDGQISAAMMGERLSIATLNPDIRVFDLVTSRLSGEELTAALTTIRPSPQSNPRSLKKLYKMMESLNREIEKRSPKMNLESMSGKKPRLYWMRDLCSFVRGGNATIDVIRTYLSLPTYTELRQRNLSALIQHNDTMLPVMLLLQVYSLVEVELVISQMRTSDNTPNSTSSISLDELSLSISTGFWETMETLRRKLPEDLVKLVIEYL